MSKKLSKQMIEILEARQLLAWSGYATLVGQDSAASTYSSITGKGITVAVIDTGIDYTQAALGGGFGAGKKVIGGYDFYDNDSDPMDESGHGTNVASVIAANSYTTGGITYRGVAPDAKLVALRVGTETNISDSNIQEALQWVIDHVKDGSYKITVINLSLGSGNYTDPQTEDVYSTEFAELKSLGVFVVAASGNSNDSNTGPISQDGIAYPAADANVFAVGAVDSSDVISSWTQRGDELDLLAPGVDITMVKMGGGYVTEDGTSFASPYVAGTAALLQQTDSTAKPGDIGSILMASGASNRDGDAETGNTTGLLFSRLNIRDAISTAARRVGKTATLDLGKSFDTALDSNGILHAAYYDTSNGRLMYATRDIEGLWSSSYVVDQSADVGGMVSIAVDISGHVGIGYFDNTNTAIKYATVNAKQRWTYQTIDSNKHVGTFPSLAYDIDGNGYLAYYRRSGGSLRMATLNRDTGAWSIQTVDDTADVGAYVSLDVNEAKNTSGFFTVYDTTIAMAYADVTNGDLKYARIDIDATNAAWVYATVDDLNGVSGIDFHLHNGPLNLGTQAQMSYIDSGSGAVKYAYKNNTWFTETVASAGQYGGPIGLSFDVEDDPIIAFYQSTKRSIYTATRSGTSTGTWTLARVAAGSGLLSVGLNQRTGDSLLSLLNRARTTVATVTL